MKSVLLLVIGLWMSMPMVYANPICKVSWIDVRVNSTEASLTQRDVVEFSLRGQAHVLIDRHGSLVHKAGATVVRFLRNPDRTVTVDVEGAEAGQSPMLVSATVTKGNRLNVNAGHLNVSCYKSAEDLELVSAAQ